MASAEAGSPSSSGAPTCSPARESRVRYDRGMRIWGAEGQDALERASVCLLHAGPTGAEALKNLVLGGIRSFTVVDGERVGPQDLGNNFMIDQDALGRPRAEVVTASLKELNEAVGGSYVVDEPAQLISSNPSFFHEYDLVIGAQLRCSDAAALDAVCRERGIPLILGRAYGLVGLVQVCVAEHCVVESKPDNTIEDLRLTEPWPELAEAAAQVDAGLLDDHVRGHVPYALLLIRAAAAWAATHGAPFPRTSAEKADFKEGLRSLQRCIEGVPVEEENITEAIANAHRVWSGSSAPTPELVRLFQDEACQHLRAGSSPFWICVAALSRFVASNAAGALPLEGNIPDMHAGSQEFLALQRLYRAKAEADAQEVEGLAHDVAGAAGASVSRVTSAYVRSVCKNARRLRVIRCPALHPDGLPVRTEPEKGGTDALRQALASEDATASTAAFSVLVPAADRYYRTHQRFPGSLHGSEVPEGEVSQLHAIAQGLLAESGISGVHLPEDATTELVRWGGAELHCVAAIIGSIASQEAIKLLTGQFVPLAGTLFYSTVHATSLLFA
ncbi:NEDD8-activating enzyme E1 regulatory subunit [Auxenochlorella protothecoides]|nr:NEDD8-activating enzyme E1 regulatory subunit [Auxenochlorella protothecoides]KFM26093.1 NEDD8-activating enzyme E1 regulatory subunit [Auxenochlorella protothecoides]